jgi:signal transduction histidine kinase
LAESALEVVLLELLKNAKKFHPRHEPRVEITVVPTATNRVRIEVMDDGVTLSATQLDHIWTPYYQSERTFTGEVPGMGLGLAMVRNIIWQAGGTCQARNRRDGPGLAIEIELPMCAAAVPGQAVCQTVIA